MSNRFIHATFLRATNLLLIIAALLIVCGTIWEYATRSYLRGFTDAVVPSAATPEQKIEAILAWMSHGPPRRSSEPGEDFAGADRDPENTLNYGSLLKLCGTATNAFVNLADSSGLRARRLLLLSPSGTTSHVVAEVHLDQRWVVIDPAFRTILRNAAGNLLTREELSNPDVFQQATAEIPGYDSDYNYAHTEHVHVHGIPLIGGLLQKTLDFTYPQWKESLDWTLLFERRSYAVLAIGLMFFLIGLVVRQLVDWYGRRYLSLTPVSLLAPARRFAQSFVVKDPNPLRTDRI